MIKRVSVQESSLKIIISTEQRELTKVQLLDKSLKGKSTVQH